MAKSKHEDPDRNEQRLILRLPGDLLERIKKLERLLSKDPELSTFGRISTSAVARLALLRGVAALENQYSAAPRPKSSAKGKRGS